MKWTLLAADSACVCPAARAGHCVVCVSSSACSPSSDVILVCGGANRSGVVFNDAFLYHSLENRYTALPFWTDAIPARTSHSVVVAASRRRHHTDTGKDDDDDDGAAMVVFVFGGHDVNGAPLCDLYAVNLATSTVTRLKDAPQGRHSHAMCLASRGNELIIVGGACSTDGTLATDILSYDIRANEWAVVATRNTPRDADVRKEMLHIGAFAAGADAKDRDDTKRVIVYGGRAQTTIFGDVRVLDFTGHVSYSNEYLLEDGRCAAAYCVRGNELVVIGGFDGSSMRNDVAAIDSSTLQWTYWTDVRGPPIPGRFAAAATYCKGSDCIYVFGGSSLESELADLWRLHCSAK
eukprot:ANDGO_00692.mRNA.1 hypothetical protein SAMD00019534_106980